jgi:hypothetical protein
MENPSDDPRQFAHDDAGLGEDIPPGMDTFLRVSWLQIIKEPILTLFAVSLQTLMDRGMRQNAQTSTRSTTGRSVISDYFLNQNKTLKCVLDDI